MLLICLTVQCFDHMNWNLSCLNTSKQQQVWFYSVVKKSFWYTVNLLLNISCFIWPNPRFYLRYKFIDKNKTLFGNCCYMYYYINMRNEFTKNICNHKSDVVSVIMLLQGLSSCFYKTRLHISHGHSPISRVVQGCIYWNLEQITLCANENDIESFLCYI